jgi:hypothetical protein
VIVDTKRWCKDEIAVWRSLEKDGRVCLMGGVIGLNWMANVHTNSGALSKSVDIFAKTEMTAWNGKLVESPGVGQRDITDA